MELITTSREQSNEIITSFGLVPVKIMNIEKTGEKPVWDLTLLEEKDVPHAIITNGLVTHNSSSPDYIENIMKSMSVKGDITNVFGLRDNAGHWAIKPRVRYYQPTTAEAFFDSLAKLLRTLPDIKMVGEKQYYVWPDEKVIRAKVKDRYDEKLLKRTGMLHVETERYIKHQALFIVDSYPAMLPEKQDEDDPGSAMAVQARMFSEQIKRVKSKLKPKKVTIIGINQLRLAPMVSYGNPEYEPCFIGSTPVLLADGTTDTIRNIVRKKRRVKVLSFCKETGRVSAKKIIDWKFNGTRPYTDFCKLVYTGYDRKGLEFNYDVTCTKEHKIWTPKGWVEAGELKIGDYVYLNIAKDTYNRDQEQLIYGSLLGDGVFSSTKNSISWRVLYSHVRYQTHYMLWKANTIDFGDAYEIFKDSNKQRYRPMGKTVSYNSSTHFNAKIARYARILSDRKAIQSDSKKEKITKEILANLDLRGLAIWYMDDGHFANDTKNGKWRMSLTCDRFTDRLKTLTIKCIKNLTGSDANISESNGKIIISGKDNCIVFQEAISKYIHPSMSWKIADCEKAGSYSWSKSEPERTYELKKTKIVSVEAPSSQANNVELFDLTIKDNHTYLVGGSANNRAIIPSSILNRTTSSGSIAVSNCGKALQLFSDARIRCASRSIPHGKGQFEEEPSVTGKGIDTYRYVNWRAIKNKLGSPNLEGWGRIWVSDNTGKGRGFCPVYDVYQYLVMTGQISGSRNKLVCTLPQFKGVKLRMSWMQLKTLVSGKKEQQIEVQKKLGCNNGKYFNLRKECFNQFNGGKAMELFFEKKAGNVEASGDEDE